MRLPIELIEQKLTLVRKIILFSQRVLLQDNQNPWCFILESYISNTDINKKNALDTFSELQQKMGMSISSIDELNWGDPSTRNSLNLLVYALYQAGERKLLDDMNLFISLLVKVVENANAETLLGLSQKKETGDWAGTTPWYWVMGALQDAAREKSWDTVDKIVSLLASIVEKVDAGTLLSLSQKRETGDAAGATPWYWVMGALRDAAHGKSWSTADKIVSLLASIVEKVNTETLLGLSQKIETGIWAGTTPWYWVMNALQLASRENDDAQIMKLVIIIFEKFDPSSIPPLWSTLLHEQDCDDMTFQVVQRLLLLNLVPLQKMNDLFLKEIKNNSEQPRAYARGILVDLKVEYKLRLPRIFLALLLNIIFYYVFINSNCRYKISI